MSNECHKVSVTKDGVAEMFSGRGLTPWHGLGQVVAGLLKAAEAINAAHLDWTVSKQKVYTKNGKITEIPKWNAIVRDDTHKPLGIVKSRHTPIQNADCFDFMDALAGEGKVMYDTAGALRGGRHVWMAAKIEGKDFTIGKDDKHEQWLLLVNSHDQTYSLMVQWVTVRVVCNNTFTAALGNTRNQVKIRHCANWKDKAAQAKSVLGLADDYFAEMQKTLQSFGTVDATPALAAEFTKLLFPARDKDGKALEINAPASPQTEGYRSVVQRLFNRPSAGTYGQTRYDIFNAVTDYADHFQKVGKTSSRIESSLLPSGNGQVLKERALKLLTSEDIMADLLARSVAVKAQPAKVVNETFADLVSK